MLMLLEQHASLHSSRISDKNIWSFEDAILDGISDYTFRQIPKNHEHSIAWCIWHIARIEDITMNMLVDCIDQVFKHDNWQDQLNIRFKHSGNEMKQNEIEELSKTIDLLSLREYRLAVGKRTREIIAKFNPLEMNTKVEISRIQKVKEKGAVVESAYGITDYWSKRTIGGLFLMPATRHNIVHLNEALRLKKKLT
jgi:hypothetical protein